MLSMIELATERQLPPRPPPSIRAPEVLWISTRPGGRRVGRGARAVLLAGCTLLLMPAVAEAQVTASPEPVEFGSVLWAAQPAGTSPSATPDCSMRP
jgi:hypothetical protein